MLIALAALTAVTGARTAFIFFKVCPVLLGATAALKRRRQKDVDWDCLDFCLGAALVEEL
jgi:hypothetical protein